MRALVLSAHTDDAELGAGGTMARLVKRGETVKHSVFSICAKPEHLEEFYSANEVLGIPRAMNELLDMRHRTFIEDRQKVLQHLCDLRQSYEPELVLCPYLHDVHQDHQTVAMETIRAFGHQTTIWMYELPYNCPNFDPTIYVPLEEEYLELKLEALQKYSSMLDRPYFDPDVINSLMVIRGLQCGSPRAEAFHGYRTMEKL